jgi:cytoskeletal protein RodZ
MARRWVLTGIVAVALVVAAVFAAHAIRDDDTAAPAPTTTTTGPTTSTTAAPTSTTGAPTTTVAVAGPTTDTATTTAPAADAPPGPCGADTGPVRAAIDAGVADARADAEVASCRLAASDPSWAAVQLAAKPGATFRALTVILHGGAGAWSIVASGGTDAGCGSAPQQVIVDLGQFCAGTGGGT